MTGCHHLICSVTRSADIDVKFHHKIYCVNVGLTQSQVGQDESCRSRTISYLRPCMLIDRLACDCQKARWRSVGGKYRGEVSPPCVLACEIQLKSGAC